MTHFLMMDDNRTVIRIGFDNEADYFAPDWREYCRLVLRGARKCDAVHVGPATVILNCLLAAYGQGYQDGGEAVLQQKEWSTL